MKSIASVGVLILAVILSANRMTHGQGTHSHPASVLPYSGEMSQFEESKLAHWKPDAHRDTTPWPEIRRPGISLDGTWRVSRGLDSTTLWIRTLPSGGCVVTFQTGGCEGDWTLKRTGQFMNGVLTLDRPVAEYLPQTYLRLYVVRVGSTDYLVPAPAVRAFEAHLNRNPHRRVPTFSTGFYGLQRVVPSNHADKGVASHVVG